VQLKSKDAIEFYLTFDGGDIHFPQGTLSSQQRGSTCVIRRVCQFWSTHRCWPYCRQCRQAITVQY